jgi:anti-anti-sigma factor
MEFNIRSYNETIIICELSGRLLIDDEINQIIKRMEEFPNVNIVMNLEKLEYTSSSGLSLFVRLLTRTRIQDKKIVLTNLQANVKKLFNITKLDDIFIIFDSENEAINSL